jgi:hypothetical protein
MIHNCNWKDPLPPCTQQGTGPSREKTQRPRFWLLTDAGLAFDRMRAEEGVVPSLWWFEVPKHSDRERTAAADYRIRYRLFSAEPFAAATPHRPVSRRKRDPPAGAQSDVVGLRCRVSGIGPAGGITVGNPGRRPAQGSGRRRGGPGFQRRWRGYRVPAEVAGDSGRGRGGAESTVADRRDGGSGCR